MQPLAAAKIRKLLDHAMLSGRMGPHCVVLG
jgi:hypothetical protein